MTTLADFIEIGNVTIRNRSVMPPMVRRLASETGEVTEKLLKHYEARSKGGVGLIVVEASAVAWEHRISENNIGIYDDNLVPGLSKLAARIKMHGAAAFIQLNHSGPKKEVKTRFVGPSPIAVKEGPIPEELNLDEIEEIKSLFVDAARRASEAGFDGIEVHAAHFFLLSSFLSSYSNQRNDDYGGTTIKKSKLVTDIIRSIRKEAGSFAIQCRMNGIENYIRGIDISEAKEIAQIIEKAGVDSLHISGYNAPLFNTENLAWFSEEKKPAVLEGYPWGCYIPCAAAIKEVVDVPVIGVGMVRDPDFAEKVIRDDFCNLVAIGRGLLADPTFVQKTLSGKGKDIIPWKDELS